MTTATHDKAPPDPGAVDAPTVPAADVVAMPPAPPAGVPEAPQPEPAPSPVSADTVAPTSPPPSPTVIEAPRVPELSAWPTNGLQSADVEVSAAAPSIDIIDTRPPASPGKSWWQERRERLAAQRQAASPAVAETIDAPAVPARRKSWREQRWERRRRRRLFEEVLGWILVPTILLGTYWAVTAGLEAMGTSPAALVQGIQTILANYN